MSSSPLPPIDLVQLERSVSLGYLLNTIAHDLNNLLTNLLLGIDQLQASGGEETLVLVRQQAQRIAAVTQAVQGLGQRNLMEGRNREDFRGLAGDFLYWHKTWVGGTLDMRLLDGGEVSINCQRQSLLCAFSLLARCTLSEEEDQPLIMEAEARDVARFAWSDSGETVCMLVLRFQRGEVSEEQSPHFKEMVDGFMAQDRSHEEVLLMAACEILRKHRGRIECYGWGEAGGTSFVVHLPLAEEV